MASKGKRLIILHAITANGPLCERDSDGKPIDDLEWKGDTPHPKKKNPSDKLTCKTLWLATSKSGDYHDNMNSDMFMQWTNDRLIPTFEKLYPGKMMILVCDNAPYHHKREIGSMNTKTKKELLDMMTKDEVDWIELPLNTERSEYMDENGAEDCDEGTPFDVTDPKDAVCNFGETMGIRFDPDEQKQTANSTTRPRVATVEELKTSYMLWLKLNKPEKLECKVEKLLNERGYEILWTPPYCPDLQPIELFWAAGKNYAASLYYHGRKMQVTVDQLREGWYGMFGITPEGEERKKPVDCNKL
jgi:hypothetical protein